MALSALVAAISAERDMLGKALDCQKRLIAALDAQDADAIIAASAALAEATDKVRSGHETVDRPSLELGLKQAEAARIRVKYLTAWNRQKIDRLAEYRGQSSRNVYARPQESV
jgi:ABC-type transporter Mla subunit MlaD